MLRSYRSGRLVAIPVSGHTVPYFFANPTHRIAVKENALPRDAVFIDTMRTGRQEGIGLVYFLFEHPTFPLIEVGDEIPELSPVLVDVHADLPEPAPVGA